MDFVLLHFEVCRLAMRCHQLAHLSEYHHLEQGLKVYLILGFEAYLVLNQQVRMVSHIKLREVEIHMATIHH